VGPLEPFGLSVADRWQHVLMLGKTGVGKSTLLRNLLIQDIQAGRGVLFIDPRDCRAIGGQAAAATLGSGLFAAKKRCPKLAPSVPL
jgi:ABC-type transport system involved in cytochrome bd biosynthesis fused ATPase/permease subunit